MLQAFLKGAEQLNDKATRRVLWLGILAAIAVLAILWSLIGLMLTRTAVFDIGWLESAIDILGGLATLVLTWFMFPAVISAVVGIFLDDVANAVEGRHYPGLPAPRNVPLGDTLRMTFKFLAILVVLNLVALVFLFVPPLFPFVFYSVNGYLLGREYFELVAMRRLPSDEILALRRRHGRSIFFAGVLTALLLTIPVINLLAPIIATAAMVHLFEGWRSRTA